MGLDFSHCDARWAYSGFNRFRNRLSAAININYENMEGCGGDQKWEEIKDAILPLLNHSDCDGELSPEECKTIAPRLLEIIAPWPNDDYDKIQATELAEGMQWAASKNENLEFC